VQLVRWRRWGLALTVLATLGGLTVAGRLLDPASAYQAGEQGSWWRPTRLQAGLGCYGLQIDGVGFSEVLVVEFG